MDEIDDICLCCEIALCMYVGATNNNSKETNNTAIHNHSWMTGTTIFFFSYSCKKSQNQKKKTLQAKKREASLQKQFSLTALTWGLCEAKGGIDGAEAAVVL